MGHGRDHSLSVRFHAHHGRLGRLHSGHAPQDLLGRHLHGSVCRVVPQRCGLDDEGKEARLSQFELLSDTAAQRHLESRRREREPYLLGSIRPSRPAAFPASEPGIGGV